MSILLRNKIVKTRKEHNCHGCLEIIPRGTLVNIQVGVDSNRIYTIYMCDKCQNWCKGCRDCHDMESAYEEYIKECIREREDR